MSITENHFDLIVLNNDIKQYLQKNLDHNEYKQKIFLYSYIGMSDSEFQELKSEFI